MTANSKFDLKHALRWRGAEVSTLRRILTPRAPAVLAQPSPPSFEIRIASTEPPRARNERPSPRPDRDAVWTGAIGTGREAGGAGTAAGGIARSSGVIAGSLRATPGKERSGATSRRTGRIGRSSKVTSTGAGNRKSAAADRGRKSRLALIRPRAARGPAWPPWSLRGLLEREA
jgi:hypothetical protein